MIAMDDRAKRVKHVREMTGASREFFHQSYGIHANTLRSWELPQENQKGLTRKGAERLVNALQQEKIACSVEWLMHGVGEAPKYISAPSEPPPTIEQPLQRSQLSDDEIAIIFKEILSNLKTIFMDINNEYEYGQYVDIAAEVFMDISKLDGDLNAKRNAIQLICSSITKGIKSVQLKPPISEALTDPL